MKLMKHALALLAGLLFSLNVAALPILEVHDRYIFDYTSQVKGHQIQFVGELTQADPLYAWGVKDFCLDGAAPSWETCGSIDVTVTAPAGLDLFVAVYTGLDFGGYGLQILNSHGQPGLLPGGESWSFVLGGPYAVKEPHVVNILALDTSLLPPGGEPLAGVNYVDSGSSAPVTAVPEPGSVALLGAGLGLLGFTTRRRRQQI